MEREKTKKKMNKKKGFHIRNQLLFNVHRIQYTRFTFKNFYKSIGEIQQRTLIISLTKTKPLLEKAKTAYQRKRINSVDSTPTFISFIYESINNGRVILFGI